MALGFSECAKRSQHTTPPPISEKKESERRRRRRKMAESLFCSASNKLSTLDKQKIHVVIHDDITWLEDKFSWLGGLKQEDLERKQRLINNRLIDLTSIAQETENAVDNFLCYVQQHPPLRLRNKLLVRLEMLCMKETFHPRYLPSEEVTLLRRIRRIKKKMNVILTSEESEEIPAGSGSVNSLASLYDPIYDPLDDWTKICFLFHGLLPEGFKISKRRLVNLWIAEGWVQEEEKDTETIYKEKEEPFTTTSLRAVHEFCIMRAKQLNLYKIDNGKKEDSSSTTGEIISRLALYSGGIYSHMYSPKATLPTDLRSLFCFPQLTVLIGGKASFFVKQLGGLKLLRVLDLEDMYFITELPEDIGEHLTRLKYLGLRGTGLERLPSSLGKLTNLQTLDIKHTRVCSIPNSIQKLKHLRHLYMDAKHDDVVALDLSGLEELRVLSMARADPWMENGIQNLSNLTKLGIYGDLDLCKNALLNCIPGMDGLKWLRLGFGVDNVNLKSICSSGIRHLYLERPLKSLPGDFKSLEDLCLKWSQLEQDPMPTLGKLPLLKELKLRCGSFLGEKMVCSAEGFPKLNVLELNLLEGLEEWTVEERAMPMLNHLVVHVCKRLKMLPELKYLKKLEGLDVAGMPLEFSARLLRSMGSDWNQIFKRKTEKDWSEIVKQDVKHWNEALKPIMGEEMSKMLQDNMGQKWTEMLEENIRKDWSKIEHIRMIIIDGIQIQMGATSSSHQA